MDTGIGIGLYFGAGIVFGIICMIIAIGKGQQAWIGFLLGFFFTCAGLVAVLIMNGDVVAQGIPPPHPDSRWLADPTGRHQMRLWDGRRWSAHVSDGGRAGHDPLE